MIAVAERTALDALDAVAADKGIVTGLRLAEDLAWAAARVEDLATIGGPLRDAVGQEADALLAIAAVHAVSATPGDDAETLLIDLLREPRRHLAEHAAWALSARSPHGAALPDLTRLTAGGGFIGMIAQRTLRGWASAIPLAVSSAVTAGILRGDGDRARLVETLGLVPGAANEQFLTALAGDAAEPFGVRRAAVAALGDRPLGAGVCRLLDRLATGDDEVAATALLALLDGSNDTEMSADDGRLRVAQVFLYADLDHGNAGVGGGDSGGIATLLALLSRALTERSDVAEVRSLSRGSVEDALAAAWTSRGAGERFEAIPFASGERVDVATAWPHRIEIERGVLRSLRRGHRPHVLHLRLADVGTLAAHSSARRLGVPVVFTAAPDPHAILEALDGGGELTRGNLGAEDVHQHWWFRARMVEQLTRQADGVALLPRAALADDLRRLLDFDVDEHNLRCAVIPEGIHAGTVREARSVVARATTARRADRPAAPRWPSGVAALVDAIDALPADRHGLPLIVSVGRLHPAKGMDRVVQAWATSRLAERANFVLVGGNLVEPNADELDVLATLDDIVAASGTTGLVLLGRRPHADVARILAAAALGARPTIAGGGVYVCGSAKEEFGLAIVEALASGLPVVAPRRGGPATYVVDGDTGFLVDTSSVDAIAAGVSAAFNLAADRPRVEAAADHILERLTIEAMAERLCSLYRVASVAQLPNRP